MKWIDEIEQRSALVPNHTGAWSDVRKLISAAKIAESALYKIVYQAERHDVRNIYWAYASGALEELQSLEQNPSDDLKVLTSDTSDEPFDPTKSVAKAIMKRGV